MAKVMEKKQQAVPVVLWLRFALVALMIVESGRWSEAHPRGDYAAYRAGACILRNLLDSATNAFKYARVGMESDISAGCDPLAFALLPAHPVVFDPGGTPC